MTNKKSKKPVKTTQPVFSILFGVEQNGNLIQDVVMKEGYERIAAETLFRMSQGVIGQTLLAVLCMKYPHLADLVTSEIEILANNFLAESGHKAWLNAPAVDVEQVFGPKLSQNQQG